MEHAFMQMFSLREKFESLFSPTGMPMGEDPYSDARQSICCIAKMMDNNITRALINLEDDTEAIVVDVVALDGVTVWALPDRNQEPIIFVRFAYHTRDYKDPFNNPVAVSLIAETICDTVPDNGMVQSVTAASKEEMKLLNGFLQDNAAKMDEELRAKVEASADKKLFKIPLSYTSFVTPLTRSEDPPDEKCKVCGAPTTKICNKCKVAKYCSRDCQTQDWKAGHRNECKRPEEIAKEARDSDVNNNAADDPWVDIDPKQTPKSLQGFMATVSNISPCMSSTKGIQDTKKMAALPGIKRDSVMMVKVQSVLGSRLEDYQSILIYPQGKKFQISVVPENIVKGHADYRRLWMLIRTRGSDAGLGMGGCKAYFDAYVTTGGLLRIMIDKMKPIQRW
jgi:hypothetical protein